MTVLSSMGLLLGMGLLSGSAMAGTGRKTPQSFPDIVTFKSGATTVSAYLVIPAERKKGPAVIVIHEWWGLNDWAKQRALDFAAAGYTSLAVDLYRGKSTADAEEAHEFMRGMPPERALGDLRAAVDYLAALPEVDPNAIGVIGWCMGGGYAWELAAADSRIKAAAVNYGATTADSAVAAKTHAAILGNFGGKDRGISTADVAAFEKALATAGKISDIKIYPDAGHGFMNPGNKEGYREAAAKDAWDRILAFFARQLRGAKP